MLLGWFESKQVIAAFLDVSVGPNKESAGSSGWVLNNFTLFRLRQPHHTIDERAGREILSRARLLLRGILFKKALVKIAKTFLFSRVPVEAVNLAHQFLEIA